MYGVYNKITPLDLYYKYHTFYNPKVMNGMDVVVFDLETLRLFSEAPLINLGVSVLVAYSYLQDRYIVFTEDEMKKSSTKKYVWDLFSNAAAIVSHNGLRFDHRVLEVALGQDFRPLDRNAIDFYRDVLQKHSDWKNEQYARVSLKNIAKRTVGGSMAHKSLNGVDAVYFWRSGDPKKRQIVIDYCVQDVRLTRAVLEVCWMNCGRIKFMNPVQLNRMQNNLPLTGRLFGTCLVKFPPALQALVPKKKTVSGKKPKQAELVF